MTTEKPPAAKGNPLNVTIIAIIALIIVVIIAQRFGIFAKVGINLGVVQLDLQGNGSATPPSTTNSGSPSTNSVLPNAVTTASSSCPAAQGWYELVNMEWWYGPVLGYYVLFDRTGTFWTWDSSYGYRKFGYSNGQVIPRNQWLNLTNTRVSVCVDSMSHAFMIVSS